MTAIKTKSTNVAKGFALYVGISEQDAQDAGLTLAQIALALNQTIATLIPAKSQETYAAIALAPEGSTGRNLDITRLALREPRATNVSTTPDAQEKTAAKGLVVDLTRRRLFVDGRNAQATCKEFELFAFLIENTGQTVTRTQIANISERCGEATPNARTIDVHVRRLRAKIAGYEDVIRSARGVGYRFDKHPDVLVEQF
jgi:DNA-binding response OmpR family regulator